MNLKRATLVGAGGGALAVWLAAAATPGGRPAVIGSTPRAAAVDVRGAELATEVERLRERLRPTAEPRAPGRNLFRYGEAARAARRADAGPAIDEPVAPRPRSSPPSFEFIGLAEDSGPGGVVRTAIVADAGQLLFAREGETLTPQYRVSRISADVLEIVDVGDGAIVRLVLK
jgi:hypothetical protein